MLYTELHNKPIKLPKKGTVEIDAGEGAILVPLDNGKIFLHWVNDKGQINNTHQLRFSTKVTKKLRLVNGESRDLQVMQIDL